MDCDLKRKFNSLTNSIHKEILAIQENSLFQFCKKIEKENLTRLNIGVK